MLSWRAVDIFALLGHEARFNVLTRLVDSYPTTLTVAEMASALDMSRSSARRHMYKLADAGLVCGRRSGRTLRFQAELPIIADFVDYIEERLTPRCAKTHTNQRPGRGTPPHRYVSLCDRLNEVSPDYEETVRTEGHRRGSLRAALDRLARQWDEQDQQRTGSAGSTSLRRLT